jgi:hypothetical protein
LGNHARFFDLASPSLSIPAEGLTDWDELVWVDDE